MSHILHPFFEPLESRRHLAAHPPPLTPEQEVDLGLVAAAVAAMKSAGASADPFASQLASPGTDVLTALTAPDGLDLLVGGGSSNPALGAPGTTFVGVAAGTPPPSGTDAVGSGLTVFTTE